MSKEKAKNLSIATAPSGTWVQTDRGAHEKWAKLAILNPRASSVLHVMIAQMGRHNALIASLPNLAKTCGCSRSTLIRALNILRKENWVEVRQIGASSSTNAYIINDRVAWSGNRDGIRYSLFSATVLVSDNEQPDKEEIGIQSPLMRLPSLYLNEQQLPSGNGLPPPSEPSLPGLEPDLPFKLISND